MADTVRPHLTAGRAFAFGSYVLDPVRRLLWCEGRVVTITDKAFDVLATLVANHDRPLQKEELLKQVWPGTFVQENNLVRHVSMVRRALGQSPEQHDYIVTLPGHGYRFVAAVTEIDSPTDLPTNTRPEPAADASAMDPREPDAASATPADLHAAPAPHGVTPPISTVAAPAAVSDPVYTPQKAASAPTAGAPSASPRARWLWLTAAAGLAVVAFAGVVFTRAPEAAPPRALRQMTYGPEVQVGPTWSPDQRALAYSSNKSGDFEIWVQPLDQPEPVRVTSSPSADWQPSWSPDGRLLAFRSEGQGTSGLYVISPRGEGLRQVSAIGERPSWSPDSAQILFQAGQVERLRPQPYTVGLDGAPPQPARADLTKNWVRVRAAWHPDGDLTFWGRDSAGAWTMVKAPLKGGAGVRYVVPRPLVQQMEKLNLTLRNFTWSPRGDFIYFEGLSMQVRNLWRVHVNPETLAWSGVPERLTLGDGSDSEISLSRDGKRLAFAAIKERTRLWSLPLDGAPDTRAGQPLTPGGAGEFDAAVSSDGRVLVYSTVRAGRQELWARSIPEKTERLLISSTDWVRSSPRLSSDGRRVAYRLTSPDPSHAKPAVAILEPNGAEVVVSAAGAQPFVPSDWSADGATLLGACLAPGVAASVCTLTTLPHSEPRVVLSEPNREFFSARYSPNQQWMLMVERIAPRRPVWPGAITVMPAAGGARVAITDGTWNDEKPRWSADGRTIYFVSDRGGLLNLWGRRFNPEKGRPEGDVFQVTRFNSPTQMLPTDMSQVETSISGRQVVLPLTEMTSTIWTLDGIDH